MTGLPEWCPLVQRTPVCSERFRDNNAVGRLAEDQKRSDPIPSGGLSSGLTAKQEKITRQPSIK